MSSPQPMTARHAPALTLRGFSASHSAGGGDGPRGGATFTNRERLPTDFVQAGLAGRRVHFVGVAGSGMRGLAELVARRGGNVSGSDAQLAGLLDTLKMRGGPLTTATLYHGHEPGHLPSQLDWVVASAAIGDDNPELIAARRRGLPVIKYAAMLGLVMAMHRGLAVAGTHGKSTTTGLLSYILTVAGLDPTMVCGADIPQLGGHARIGDGPWLVAESCEFDRSFLNLHPRAAAVLNIEADHLDCYANLDEITGAFGEFANHVPADGLLVVNGEDPTAQSAVAGLAAPVETFGRHEGCHWQASNLRCHGGLYAFDVHQRGAAWGRFKLAIPGVHNVLNALAAMALADYAGVRAADLREALATYTGADRRLSLRGRPGHVAIIDDYAHHPTEIRATIPAARQRFVPPPGRLWCVFEPHQHSRTQSLLAEFATALAGADGLYITDIYAARDTPAQRVAVHSRDLVAAVVAAGGQAEYGATYEAVVASLAGRVAPGDGVLIMGAGTVGALSHELVRRLH